MSDYIIDDVLHLVLERLPIKTLKRFQCVCKSWKQLIASKFFILDHLALQKPSIIAQVLDDDELGYHLFDPLNLPTIDILEYIIPMQPEYGSTYTFSTLHGVICYYNYNNILSLYNPSINKILRLPLPASSSFANTAHFKYCGFSIDPSNNDFKIVIFCLETKTAVLFSSKNPKWMEVSMGEIPNSTAEYSSPQVMIDGVAYWSAYDEVVSSPGFIVSFDFEHETFTTMLPIQDPTSIHLYLCKWRDLLAVAHNDFNNNQVCVCDFWVMQNGSWSKLYSIDLSPDVYCAYCVLDSSCRVLACHRTENLVLHDPVNGVIPLNTEFSLLRFTFSYDFVESLVFPDDNFLVL